MRYSQYIPHDINARFSEQTTSMIEGEGGAGYGLYWAILEHLRAQDHYIGDIRVVKNIARHLKIRNDKAMRVLNDYDLFVVEGNRFYSPALMEMMQPLEEKRAKQDTAKKKRKGSLTEEEKEETEAEEPEKAKQLPEEDEHMPTNNLTMPENVVSVSKTSCNLLKISKSSHKVNKSKEKKTKGKNKNKTSKRKTTASFKEKDDDDAAYSSWIDYIDALRNERAWKNEMIVRSGRHWLVSRYFNEALEYFKRHLISIGNEERIVSMAEAKRYFCYYITPDSITYENLITHLQNIHEENPYRYEYIDKETGKRMYCGLPIPDDAPPRPNENACWVPTTRKWS